MMLFLLIYINPDEKSSYSINKHLYPLDAASNATPAPEQPPFIYYLKTSYYKNIVLFIFYLI